MMGKEDHNNIMEGIYIINNKYEIIYIDPVLKNIFPNGKEHELCYTSMRGNSSPCKDCPIKKHQKQGRKSSRQLLYYDALKCWLECNITNLEWPNEGTCELISMKHVIDDDHKLFLNFNHNARYDELIEFNTQKDTYELLFYNHEQKYYPFEGTLQEFIKDICFQYVYPDDQSAFMKFWDVSNMKQRVQKLGNISGEFRLSYQKDEYHWISFYINPVEKHNEQDTYLCFTLNIDKKYIVENKTIEDALFQVLDPLTGLYNSAAFHKQVKKRLDQHPDIAYGIVNIDIEHFKLFNDWYGVNEGDKLLLFIAGKIAKISEERQGICARIGGDDFVILLPQNHCNIMSIEKEIIRWMQDYDPNIKFLPNGGVYLIDDVNIPVTLMCDRAALALNSVKGNYSTRVALYNTSMKQKLENEQEVLFGVKRGLDKHEFVVYYQPQCSARTGKMIGAEALVRWNHPSKGLLPPSEFIPILEASGFISKLDYYVWEEVCRFQHERLKQGARVIPISVNVSRMDIYQYHICDVFTNLVKQYQLDPKLIEIEITESAYTEDFRHLIDAVKQLRDAGFIVLMDDFGSGYSSLNMLKDIEIDVLKIDMKFLEMSEYSALKSTSILESIVQMGKWLGLRLIAEGVETKDQMDKLLNIDCEYMQGYYFYKPISAEMFESLLQNDDKTDTRGILAKRLPSIKLDDLFHKDITSEGMLNNILGGIALYEVSDDEHITIKMVNDSYYRMTGCNSVDLCERQNHIAKQVHPDDMEIFLNIFRKAETSSTLGASGLFRRFRLSGEVMWMHLHAFYLRRQGHKKIFYGAVSDYTETMNLQKGMMRLLGTIPGNVVEVRVKDDNILSRRLVCAGLAKLHGYSEEEYRSLLESKESLQLLHPEDRDEVYSIMTNAKAWGDQINFEFRTCAKDGSVLWQNLYIKHIDCEEGVDIYNQLSTDITLIKSQEEELMNSQQTLQRILGITNASTSSAILAKENRESAAFLFSQALPNGMLGGYCEDGFPIYFANEEMIHLLGYDSYEDLVDGIDGMVENAMDARDLETVKQDIGTTIQEGKEYSTRYRMKKKDGSFIWVIDKRRVVKAEDGRLAIISSCMDITETMNTKLKLEEAREDITLLNSLVPGGYHQCYCDEGYTYKHMSNRFLEMLGFTKEDIQEFFDNKFLNMVVPQDRYQFQNVHIHKGMKEYVYSGQYRMYSAKGILWVRDQTRLVVHDDECYFAGIIEDISDIITMQEKIEAIVSNTPGDVFSIEQGKMMYHSYNLAKTMGYTVEEYKDIIQKTNGSYFTDPRDREKLRELMRISRDEQSDVDVVFRSLDRYKKTRYIHMKAVYSQDIKGIPLYYGIMIDATAAVLKERELKVSQQMFDSIIQQAHLNIWEYDSALDRLQISKDGLAQICDDIPDFFMLSNDYYLLHDFTQYMNHMEYFSEKMFHVLSYLKEKIEQQDFENAVIDLSVYQNYNQWMKITCEGIYDNDHDMVKVIGYFQNVTKEIEKEVLAMEEKKYAQFDSLTGIYNRRMGEILIQNVLSQQDENKTSALLMVDVDNFKYINDHYGHIRGDHVLKMISHNMKKIIGKHDILCRLGGDEFLIHIQYNTYSDLMEKVEQMIVGARCTPQEHAPVPLGISIGIALSPMHGNDLSTLYDKADQALYEAKSHGKNQYRIYHEKNDG